MVTNQEAGRPTRRRKVVTPETPEVVVQAGFCPEPTLYTLTFVENLAALVVKVRPMSFGDMLERDITLDWSAPGVPVEVRREGLRVTSTAFASVLAEWNLTDRDGTPVPATWQGLCSLDDGLAQTIVMVWAIRVLGVSVPLAGRSTSGETSPAVSIPTETLSPSLAS